MTVYKPGFTPPVIKPVVAITSPLDGATISGSSTIITANVTSETAVTQVEFFVDDTSIGIDNVNDGWSITWDSLPVTDGSHSIKAVATAGDTTGEATISIIVKNSPVITITKPTSGSDVNGESVLIEAAVDSIPDTTQVEFFVNDVSIGIDNDINDGWSYTWNLTEVGDGNYEIRATATNALLRTGSVVITVNVDNAADPTIKVIELIASDPAAVWVNKVTWKATVKVTLDQAISDAIVTGTWSDGSTGTGTTTDGICTINSPSIIKKVASTTFTITNINVSGFEFDPSGPSSVTVNRP